MKNNINIAFWFRLGLACFFLVNSLSAFFSPSEFAELVQNNSFISSIANSGFWVTLIGINDGLLFILILLGAWKKSVAIWAGIWIVVVLFVTNAGGFEAIDFIEHIGVLSLIAYYYFAFARPNVIR